MSDEPNSQTSKKSWRFAIVLVAVCVLVALVVGGIYVTSNDDSPTTTTQPPTTETTLAPLDAKIIGDYRAFWDAYLEASDPMRPDHPALQEHATGEQLRQVVEGFSSAKLDNVVFRGSLDLNPKVVSVAGNKAVVSDCLLDKGGIYDVTTGERKDVEDTERQLNTIELELIDGTWKASMVTKERGTCVAP